MNSRSAMPHGPQDALFMFKKKVKSGVSDVYVKVGPSSVMRKL